MTIYRKNFTPPHYYRETFHSDILKALLDPEEKHNSGNKYLNLFLQFLCDKHLPDNLKIKIDLKDYSNAQVLKEKGRIDILIKGCGHAIIIENKILGAADQEKQLFRYLETAEKEYKYNVDAIVYLRLNKESSPDMSSWTDEQKRAVKDKLIIICAFNGNDDRTEKDLLNGWILKCEKASTENSDAHLVLRQYGKIIKKLGAKIMSKPIMKDFYDIMTKDGNFETAQTLQKMLHDLNFFRRDRITNEFKGHESPFKVLKDSDQYDCAGAMFSGLSFEGVELRMDVWCEADKSVFLFLDADNREAGKDAVAKELLKQMGCLDEYKLNEKREYFKEFPFPSHEAALINHIKAFKTKLAKELNGKGSSLTIDTNLE